VRLTINKASEFMSESDNPFQILSPHLNTWATYLLEDGEFNLEVPQRRVIASLVLLLGVTFLVIGLQSRQASTVLDIVKRILEASVAGAP